MFILYETPAGLALFKNRTPKATESLDAIRKQFKTKEKTLETLKLVQFVKFGSTEEALESTELLAKGKMPSVLKTLLKNTMVEKKKYKDEKLLVGDAKLMQAIKKKYQLKAVANEQSIEFSRGIRENIAALIDALDEKTLRKMQMGLGHSYSQAKLEFSVEKVDTVVVQAVSVLDDVDKEINNCVMRLREWYGWHFPEIGNIVADGAKYAKLVKKIGMRESIEDVLLDEVVSADIEEAIRDAAKMSMGTEISPDDLAIILGIADQVLEMTAYRAELNEYLQNRIRALTPNICALVGDVMGARLVSHAGSVRELSKKPASTIQLLGSESALFRALKARQNTPKYGMLYNSLLIKETAEGAKGTMARKLAAKLALAARVDAMKEKTDDTFGKEMFLSLQKNIRQCEIVSQNKAAKARTKRTTTEGAPATKRNKW